METTCSEHQRKACSRLNRSLRLSVSPCLSRASLGVSPPRRRLSTSKCRVPAWPSDGAICLYDEHSCNTLRASLDNSTQLRHGGSMAVRKRRKRERMRPFDPSEDGPLPTRLRRARGDRSNQIVQATVHWTWSRTHLTRADSTAADGGSRLRHRDARGSARAAHGIPGVLCTSALREGPRGDCGDPPLAACRVDGVHD